jgi:hypothetical protein
MGFATMGVRAAPSIDVRMETKADLEAMAVKLNPTIKFWDPLGLTDMTIDGSSEQAIGWLRHAEIKHGRVAMFAFVGFVAQSAGLYFPWNLNLEGTSFADIAAAGSPFEQWDALPTSAKLQILGAIGVLEYLGEGGYGGQALANSGEKHYMKGGTPGKYPSLKTAGVPHPVPFDLFDPFGLSKNASPEKKAKGLVAEINNGRLAMIGIMGFCAAAKVPGSVPGLTFIAPYAGEPMGPFSATDSALPMVTGMLELFAK